MLIFSDFECLEMEIISKTWSEITKTINGDKNKLNLKKIALKYTRVYTHTNERIHIQNFRILDITLSVLRERQINTQILSSFVNRDIRISHTFCVGNVFQKHDIKESGNK